MIVNKLYLVTCTKRYPAYTGDTTTSSVKYLVPANDEKEATEKIKSSFLNENDEINEVELLYEIIEGPGYNEKNVWTYINGLDDDIVIRL